MLYREDNQLTCVITTIKKVENEGCPVAGNTEKLALIAVRRWSSSKRRHINQMDLKAKIMDLAKGLIAYGENNHNLIGPLKNDYMYLAEQIAKCFNQ